MSEYWTLHIASTLTWFIYTLPRGQAADLRDALAILRTNPKPEGARSLVIEELPNVYEIKIDRYSIQYQIVEQARILRILDVE